MDIALDACTIINLLNGKVLKKVTAIPAVRFFVGDTLLEQEILNNAQNILLETLLSTGTIQTLESSVTIHEFLSLKKKYELGDGETETIALCKNHNCHFASDDKRARKCGSIELGEDKVIGTLFLLRLAVQHSILTADGAVETIKIMKEKGGFLPEVDKSYFLITK